jgi:hypothetical protein
MFIEKATYKQYVPTHRPLPPTPVASFLPCVADIKWLYHPHLDPLLDVLRSAAGRVDPLPIPARPLGLPGKSLSFLQSSIELVPSALILFCAEDVRKSCCHHDVLMQTTSSLRVNHWNNFLLDEVSL